MSELAKELRKLADGEHVSDVSTMKGGFRRVSTYWLGRAAIKIEQLEYSLGAILDAWESVPENVQVPDEINDNDLWNDARAALGR